jgi:thiol:disulfide interchange protein DsbC
MRPILVSVVLMATVMGAAAPHSSFAAAPATASSSQASQTPAAPAPAVSPAMAASPAAASPAAEAAIPAVIPPGAKPEDVRPTPVPGLFEVRRGAEVLYMTQDGKYALIGDLYQLSTHNNLTEERRRELRMKLIGAVPESNMLVFGPEQAKYTITVFTDVDCVYCRALHKQIADYNRLGIRVRYMFFPRTGPDTESWHKAEQVWCSPDRKAALTRAKLGQELDTRVCANTPVAQEYALGKAVGITGTPGIVTSTGDLLPGYLPPEAMLEELKDEAAGSHG